MQHRSLDKIVSEAVFEKIKTFEWPPTITVLEAGGGSATHIKFPSSDVKFHTIDISPEQIEKNNYAEKKILGDLQSEDLGSDIYNAVICYDVLEHLEKPEAAIERMTKAIAPGGFIFVKGPLAKSFKGLVTKFTPHSFHVLVYKYVFGSKTAGKPGYAPFKTWMIWSADADALANTLSQNGFEVVAKEYLVSLQEQKLADKSKVLFFFYKTVAKLVSAVSFGNIKSNATDFYIVARKRPAESSNTSPSIAEEQRLAG